ncbi:MAG: hypothetical protein HEP71_11095 [Roseivirga sp.]|nr:hypothetical protein [Roseivirga sp.]
MTKKTDSEEPSAISVGVFLVVVCLLLILWRGPGFMDDINLFTQGEISTAVMEKKIGAKQRRGERARYLFYFIANSDTIRNESSMFEPLMVMTSSRDENFENIFKVVYDPSNPEINYPRATLRVHFLVSLAILLIALWIGISAIIFFKKYLKH